MQLQELVAKRDEIKKELIELEKAISRHPDTIRSAFNHTIDWDIVKFEELLKRISFVRWTTGRTESRKNPVPWSGYVIQFDDKVYYLRKGGNWCSDIFDYGPEGKEEDIDRQMIETLWEQRDPIKYLTEIGITEDWKMVGYLLTLSLEI